MSQEIILKTPKRKEAERARGTGRRLGVRIWRWEATGRWEWQSVAVWPTGFGVRRDKPPNY